MTIDHLVPVLGQQIRVKVRQGTGVPLVLCNGIGAGLEVLDPLVEQLNPDATVVRFDVPGTGGSPNSSLPYGFPYLAMVLGRLLKRSAWPASPSMCLACLGVGGWHSSSRSRIHAAAES